MQLRIWIITILLASGLAACSPESVPTPQPIPETKLVEPIPVTVEHITLTATPIQTNTPLPTSSPLPAPPTETPVSESTDTSIPPTSESTPLPITLQKNIDVVLTIDDVEELFWSPTNHEFVWYSCPIGESTTIQMIRLADMIPQNIAPAQLQCFYLSVLWHPTGEFFFVGGEPLPQDGYDGGGLYGWKISRDNTIPVALGSSSSY